MLNKTDPLMELNLTKYFCPDEKILKGKVPLEFKESFTEYYMDLKDFGFMKKNIWVKQLCFSGRSYFSLKILQKKKGNVQYHEEEMHYDSGIILLDYINKNFKFKVKKYWDDITRVCSMSTRRYGVKGVNLFDLDVTYFSGKGKYFFCMSPKEGLKGITTSWGPSGWTGGMISIINKNKKKDSFSVAFGVSCSNIVMWLFLFKKKLFEQLKESGVILETPKKKSMDCVCDDIDKDIFVGKKLDYSLSTDKFLDSIGVKQVILTDDEQRSMEDYYNE